MSREPARDGLSRLQGWRGGGPGAPPALRRVGAVLAHAAPGSTTLRLPLTSELRAPGSDRAPAAVTALLADLGLTTGVVASLPDRRGVTTVSMVVQHLRPPVPAQALVVESRADRHDGADPQHCAAEISDDRGALVATAAGWFLATEPPAGELDREPGEADPPAGDLFELLRVPDAASFVLHARDALSNALGTLHGGIGALATQLAAESLLPAGFCTLTSSFSYLRPTPRDGTVDVDAQVLRTGRRTATIEATMTGADGRALLRASLVAALR